MSDGCKNAEGPIYCTHACRNTLRYASRCYTLLRSPGEGSLAPRCRIAQHEREHPDPSTPSWSCVVHISPLNACTLRVCVRVFAIAGRRVRAPAILTHVCLHPRHANARCSTANRRVHAHIVCVYIFTACWWWCVGPSSTGAPS